MNESALIVFDLYALKAMCGFFGGASYAVLDRKASPSVSAASVFIGMMSAVFFGDAVNGMVGKYVMWEGSSYYVAGLCGMVILPAVIGMSRSYAAKIGKNADGDKG